jgi:hypothetical protein
MVAELKELVPEWTASVEVSQSRAMEVTAVQA